MKKFTLLITSTLLFTGIANAADIQVDGEFTEDKKGKVKVENFKACPERSVSKRRDGMGHTDLPHGTMCMGGDNCTLSITIPQGTPLPIHYYEMDPSGQCMQKQADLRNAVKATEYYGDIAFDENQISAGYDAIDTGAESQYGRVMSKLRAGSEVRLRLKYKQSVSSDKLSVGGDTIQIQY